MTLSVRDSGVWLTASPFVRDSGAWLPVTAFVRDSGVWLACGGGSSVAASADNSSIFQVYSGAGGVTGSTTVTPSGGTAPYSYAWSQVSGSGFISVDQPASASTVFVGDGLSYPTSYSAIFQCLVTDSVGATAAVLVAVEFDPG